MTALPVPWFRLVRERTPHGRVVMKDDRGGLAELRAEYELLLLCARTHLDGAAPSRIRRLLSQPIDWSRVLGAASHHGTIPLLYHHLSENGATLVPPSLLAQLQRAAITGTARRLLLVNELVPVLAELESAGAPAVVWKGPALAYSVPWHE